MKYSTSQQQQQQRRKRRLFVFSSGCWWSSSRLLLFLILVTFTTTQVLVEAACSVKDAQGKPIPLSKLPPGVSYETAVDTLRCDDPNACAGFTISHCGVVQCKDRSSCRGATFVDNQATACWAYAACQDAHMFKSHNIACGIQSVNACLRAIVQTDTAVLCFGPYACVSDKQDSILFRVGQEGRVRCEGSRGIAWSCQNIVVEISDWSRACISKIDDNDRTCAVACATDAECDHKSIVFELS